MALVLVTAGCLTTDDDDDGDGNGQPPVGTTEGFTFPDVKFRDHLDTMSLMAVFDGDFTIVHVIDSEEGAFEPQFAQIKAVLQRFENVSIHALTLSLDPSSTRDSLAGMADELDADWVFGRPIGDVASALSIVDPLTVFLLDRDHVILLREGDMLGQGRMVQAIEASWGVGPVEDAYPEVGATVPELVWRDIDGVEGALSGWEGSPVLLNVWEMECPFCMELFVELGKVHANYSGEGLRMVSIDLVTWETEEQVRGVMDEYNATWTFAIDGDNIQSRYDIWRLPLLVLLDSEGVVQWVWTGYVHSSVISGEVEKLI